MLIIRYKANFIK